MKRISVLLICIVLLMGPIAIKASAISARSAVLINGDTGEILYSLNSDERLPMASTTKIMTALLLCESGRLNESITVTDQMVRVEGSSMGLMPGDSVTLRDLLYGLMLASGNDAANTVAYVLGGSIEKFADMMNARAKKLGLEDTSFVTPSGLDAENHYTTAYNLALLAREAMKNKDFATAVSSGSATLKYGNPPYSRTVTNHNKLLKSYDGAVGVKTGFTKKAGRCLVSSAERDGKYLIAVTLNAPDDWNDHIALLDMGFSLIESVSVNSETFSDRVNIVNGEKAFIDVALQEKSFSVKKNDKVSFKVYFPDFLYAPLKSGDTVGRVYYYLNDELLCTDALISDVSVESENCEKTENIIFIFKYIISFIN